MKKTKGLKCFIAGLFLATVFKNGIPLYAGDMFSWDFPSSEIKDILFALSLDSGISIVPDETVSGKTDFRFSGNDFEKAFDSFLESSGLYAEKKENFWTISRIHVLKNDDSYVLDCYNQKPQKILEKLSEKLHCNITYEQLPLFDLSVHISGKDEADLLESLVKFFPGFEVQREEKTAGYHIAKKIIKPEVSAESTMKILMNKDGSVSVDVKNGWFSTAIEILMTQANEPFCIPGNGEIRITRSCFDAESFSEALQLLCLQNGFVLNKVNGVHYIYPKDYKASFSDERKWCYFSSGRTDLKKMTTVLQTGFPGVQFAFFDNEKTCGLWAQVNKEEEQQISSFVESIKTKKETFLIPLKYIKAKDLIERLPPGIDKDSISEADGNCCLYFFGTDEEYKKVLAEVALCDIPRKRIKYDLLILQYDDTKENQWLSNMKARNMQLGDRTSITGQLGNVMGLNLNVVSVFGLDFAINLQNSISENSTKVFADTTLFGVAGKEINFSNTNTYRYRDNNLDPETGKPVYSGVTREIVSGLKMDINSWVGEGGLLTINVKASVSRRGTDSSSVTGNPPPTSEKVVTTEVCCKSGEPVILSGLVQDSESMEQARTPYLSKIPLLGKLFRSENRNKESSQMVIYLVPFVQNEKPSESSSRYDEKWMEERKEELCRILNSN